MVLFRVILNERGGERKKKKLYVMVLNVFRVKVELFLKSLFLFESL